MALAQGKKFNLDSFPDFLVSPVDHGEVFADCPVPEMNRVFDPDAEHHLGHEGSVVRLGRKLFRARVRVPFGVGVVFRHDRVEGPDEVDSVLVRI